ncbi:MAG: hypothetical protein IT373_03270, partial [Polyangiaceae bacterium]|nr:hypothetical protein [Polyangiaceae bacterium]
KLDKLLKRDEDIVSAEQKKAYKAEFEQIYAPYQEIIDSAPSTTSSAGSGDSSSGDANATASPPSALAGTLVAMDLGVGYMFNRLQKDLDSPKVFGPYTFGTTGLLEGESGAELRVRLGLQATEGLFVYGLFRYGFLPDWKPFTVGAGLAYRPAIESIIPEIGFDMGYFKASSLSFATTPESNMSLGGYSIGLHMGVHYLVVPFMSVGVLGGLQGLALSRAALEGSDLPSECTGGTPPSYCSDLGTSQSTSGIVGYGEANMAFHF